MNHEGTKGTKKTCSQSCDHQAHMDERDYWLKLEWRVCRELDGVKDEQGRIVWCDGFVPQQYVLDANVGRVTGYVWIGYGGRDQEKWEFLLKVNGSLRGPMDWATVLPRDDQTGWLTMDHSRKFLTVDLTKTNHPPMDANARE